MVDALLLKSDNYNVSTYATVAVPDTHRYSVAPIDKRNQAMTDSVTFGFSNAEWSLQAALIERNRYRVASNTDQE